MAASLLRSSKFISRVITSAGGAVRNIFVNTPSQFDNSLVNSINPQPLFSDPTRSFATQISIQQNLDPPSFRRNSGASERSERSNLDQSLQRIDQDVRKTGRISRREIDEILEEIRSTGSATTSQSLLVIRCCGNLIPEELPEVRTQLIQEIWSTFKKLNISMDISHYNALLRVYLENEHRFSPTDFLAELESKGIEPNHVTYQRLIARYCQNGDIEGATRILEFMKEKQLPVTENVFNALITGHSELGDMDSARHIIDVMQKTGIEPSENTYTTLLCGYAKKGDIESLKKGLDEWFPEPIPDHHCLEIAYVLATNGHGDHVDVVLSKSDDSFRYYQDATNVILRLINKGQEEVAFKIFEAMSAGAGSYVNKPRGHFFIRHMIKVGKPAEKIVEMCDRMEKLNTYEKPLLLYAIENSLQLRNDTLSYALMEELRKRNLEVRQHYFWPLLVFKGQQGPSGVIDVLTQMSRFNITPNMETVREYVIPYLGEDSGKILETLREANVSVGAAACCLVHSLLLKYDLAQAAIISSRVSAYYNPDIMRRPLSAAFYKTLDLKNYMTVLRNIYDNLDRVTSWKVDEDVPNPSALDKSEILGGFLTDLAYNQRDFVEQIENVLEHLVGQGLTISTKAAEKIQEKLGERMTDDISSLLGKLTSGDLSPVPVVRKPPAYTPSSQMNIAQLERLIANLKAKNQDTKGLRRQLLTQCYRAKDLEKTEELLQELEQEDFTYTPGIYAQLCDLYAYHDQLDKALYYFEKLKETEKDNFALDESKIIRLAYLLTKSGRFDDALNILETTPRESNDGEKNYNYTSLLWRFLNSLAEQGRVDDLDKLFNTLLDKGYLEVNNVLLGPLIKVRLVNKEIDKAIEKFEWCVNHYKATPWKNELACQLIQSEDAEKLQRLTDLSTTVHGEINSLYDLVFAFVECGRIRQARKILETPGLQDRPQRINYACERYQQEGLVKPLEGLKDATRNLHHIDRKDIYYQLLLSYIKQDDPEKALDLWTQLQEEDALPTDQFLHQLGTYLEKKGLKVPFEIPEVSGEVRQQTAPLTPVQIFRNKMRRGDLDGALRVFERSQSGLTVTDASSLIERLLQGERTSEATNLTLQLLNRRITPISRVFRFLLNKLAAAGDVDSLTAIGSKLSQDMKKLVSFDNRMCHANLVKGNAESYLQTLISDLENAKDDKELAAVGEKFPRGGAYGILEKHPELLPKFEDLAIKYVKRDIVSPMNILWTYYFINGNDAKAEEVWNTYLKNSPRIMFQRIVHAAREKNDESLINKLIDHLKISKVTEGAIGNAYSCLLDVLVAQNRTEEVVNAFETALKDVSVDHINRTAVLRVKEIYDKLGRSFDHRIPARNAKNVAVSSSSATSSTSEQEARDKA